MVFFWVTTQGPASITVTGTARPRSSKICVIPTFLPRIDFTMSLRSRRSGVRAFRRSGKVPQRLNAWTPERLTSSELDLDIDAARQVQTHQRVDRLRAGVEDIDQTLVRPHLEMLHRLLVDVRAADDAEDVLLRR